MDNITDPMNIWVRRELQRAVVVQARVQYNSACLLRHRRIYINNASILTQVLPAVDSGALELLI